jgi:methionyl-tRNA formyltransferase
MRVLFAASADIALPLLRAVAASRHPICGVLTSPDSGKGRGMREEANVVAREAASLLPGLPVLKSEKLGAEARETVTALAPDILLSFAYRKIFGPKFLALFPKGGINVHPSLLPRWRGPSPIQAAILARDTKTGLSIQRLAPEMDSGDILYQTELPLLGRETSESLSAAAADAAARAIVPLLDAIEEGTETARPQEGEGVSYCGLIEKEDGLIDWSRDALDIDASVRAYLPWPLAHTFLGQERLLVHESLPLAEDGSGGAPPDVSAVPGTVISIDRSKGILVQTGRGVLALLRLQLEKKKALGHRDFANGARGLAGSRLGAPGIAISSE